MSIIRSSVHSPAAAEQQPQTAPPAPVAVVRDPMTATTVVERECAELYRRWFRRLRAVARRRGSREAAEDAVHEVFLGLLRNWEKATSEQRSEAALVKAVHYQTITIRRKQKSWVLFDDAPETIGLLPTVDPVEPQEDAPELRLAKQVIEQLPPRCKEMFHLVRYDGYSYKEAAEMLHVSVETVKEQLKRASHLAQAAFARAGYRLAAGALRRALAPSTENPHD